MAQRDSRDSLFPVPTLEGPGLFALAREAIKGGEQDFTRLPLRRAVILLAIPMVMEMAMESLFAIADIFWVSRLGADAVATVGLTESLIATVYALAIGLSTAATATVARRIGERDVEGASLAAGQVLLQSALVGGAVGALGFAFGASLLAEMGASEGVRRIGDGFSRISLGGSFSVLFLFVLNALFRGAGDATTAMRSLWLANAINIVLGPILIFGFGPVPALGVTGAALATLFGRSCGVAYQLSLLARRRGRLRMRWSHLRPQSRVLGGLSRLASTAALQTLLETTSWLGLVRILSTFGSAALAGYTIAMRVIIFVMLPSLGFANAAATLVGQNLGAARPDRAERAVRYVGAYNFVFLGAIGLLLVIAPGAIVRLFTREPEELAFAVSCLRIHALGVIAASYGMVLVQAFNGAGDTRTPTLLNVLCFWCFKIPLAYFLALRVGLGPNGVFVSVAAAYTLLAAIAFVLFRAGRWKRVRV